MSVGATLKSKREASALSVRNVSDETNIQPWIIEALEDDSISERMSNFYARGFLNTYARFLQVPADSLLEELPVGDTASDDVLAPDDEHIPSAWNLPYAKIAVFAKPLVAVCAILLVIWLNPLALLSKLRLPSLSSPQVASVAVAGNSASMDELAAQTFDADQPLELSISAKKSTWIQLWSDGKLLVQQKLESGDVEHWKAESGFKVIVAKPAHVDVQLNQVLINAALVGHRGRIEITHQGIRKIGPETG